ncbi:siroheme synthase CysG [uncultured Tateyamaria sp.]|uniref:siroheme synthase CysG n=1 Tax=uncultured Tateyamaria sp. TaxID=455651 RepID=UPI00260D72BF|nr:siroheme synthase CysG [uncultured Tateyamaria sp.]
MKTFPMFLTMTNRRVVIVGGGEQATQKCRLILKTEAHIDILAETLDVELQSLAQAGRISWHKGPIGPAQFAGAALVFVATGCPGMDACLHMLAKASGAVVNVVDQPDLCDAITPSIVDRDPVVVAIGTEGTAPVLGRQIKTRIEEMLEPKLGDLAALAGRLRGFAADRLGPRARRDLWAWVFGNLRAQHAQTGDAAVARIIKTAIASGGAPAAAPAPVALVGAGPGSSDLITLRGVKRLQEADIIFYDRLVDPQVLELARRDAERVYVGKAPGCHSWPQDKINAVLVSAARRGQRVVRLKCGDPGVFARGTEEAEALQAAGLDYEIVPGVTAASGAAAAVGGFLTERGKTDTLVLTTGRLADDGDTPDWVQHITGRSNVAVYMGVRAAGRIVETLRKAGLAQRIHVTVVVNAQRPDQQVLHCPATALEATLAEAGVDAPAILFLQHNHDTALPQPADIATVRRMAV